MYSLGFSLFIIVLGFVYFSSANLKLKPSHSNCEGALSQLQSREKTSEVHLFDFNKSGRDKSGLGSSISEKAESVLKRKLSPTEKQAVETAHLVGIGEVGEDGTPARMHNYTFLQRKEKIRVLKTAGFKTEEREILLKSGVLGKL